MIGGEANEWRKEGGGVEIKNKTTLKTLSEMNIEQVLEDRRVGRI